METEIGRRRIRRRETIHGLVPRTLLKKRARAPPTARGNTLYVCCDQINRHDIVTSPSGVFHSALPSTSRDPNGEISLNRDRPRREKM